jgi:hypothetical protein
MNAQVRRRIEMAARVRDFLRAHPSEGAGDTAALARFEELLTRGEQLAGQQRKGVVATRSATQQRRELRESLQKKLVRYLVAVGVVASRDRADLVEQFRLPGPGVSHQAFLTAVRAMLEKAQSQKDLLVSRGMSDTLLEVLTQAVSEFEATLEASRTGRRDHVGASGDLKAVAREIVEQVRVLDGLVRFRFGNNPELITAWNSARNVADPSRAGSEVNPCEAPSSPGDIAPAA